MSAEKTLSRDRTVVVAGLALVTLVSWAYLVYLARKMNVEPMADMAMPSSRAWTLPDILYLFVMWSIMMVAMMVPSVSPLILTFLKADKRDGTGSRVPSATILLGGYLTVWIGFSLLAAYLQWLLHSVALLSPMMVGTSDLLGGVIMVGAGMYQVTPVKRACLTHCRSPVAFLSMAWRPGKWGAFRLGIRHGAYCVACCSVLMMLLFVAGVMNLFWVATITVLVLVEKSFRRGDVIGLLAGIVLMVAGGFLLLTHI